MPSLTPAQRREVEDAIEELTFRVNVAKGGRTVRRIQVAGTYKIPDNRRQELGGGSGGRFSYSVHYTNVGAPQRIEPPRRAVPIAQLERELNRLLKREGSPLPGG